MLLIRQEQYDVFAKMKRSQFIQTMRLLLKEGFPEKTEAIGDENLPKLIDGAITKLEQYNIVRECDVERFLYLMFTFSFDIASNPKYRWLQEILFDNSLRGDVKLDLLYQRGEQHLDG